MKKIIIVIHIFFISFRLFSMYGDNNDWIHFLTEENQFRAKIDQFGIVFGNQNIKATFGFKGNNVIIDGKNDYILNTIISAGIGYTSKDFSIGVGYNLKQVDKYIFVHTPVLSINLLNNNLKFVAPIQVAYSDKSTHYLEKDLKSYFGISIDPQIRYYFNLPYLSELRFTMKYGMNEHKFDSTELKKFSNRGSSIGFDFRLYFKSQLENITLYPFIKITYDTSLNAKNKIVTDQIKYNITASSQVLGRINPYNTDTNLIINKNPYVPYLITLVPSLGLSAKSDIIELYVEPSLGLAIENYDVKDFTTSSYYFAWNTYGEIYLRAIKNLEFYFEVEIGNNNSENNIFTQYLKFNTSTGVIWYISSL